MTVKIQTTEILLRKSKRQKCLAQNFYGEISYYKNIQTEKSSGIGSDIEEFAQNTQIMTNGGQKLRH